ncbi:MAG: hypothetical protein EHM30_07875 [Desulfobacteraceae bacterium]|jgi:hypothetical protein|nr:MAG: hypothetical protein EHM30_07875 [Desulfobacteraceae bacterium]
MKQKYVILKDIANNRLIIGEYAELDKEIYSLLCEEVYGDSNVKQAISGGKEVLMSALRTNNFYPPVLQADKISEAVMNLYGSGNTQPVEIYFDDIEHLAKEPIELLVDDTIESESEEIDEIFEESFEENYEEKGSMDKLKTSIKIAEDEFVDNEEDL